MNLVYHKFNNLNLCTAIFSLGTYAVLSDKVNETKGGG